MRWKRILAEAVVGGATGAAVVLGFAASHITSLEDLDHLGSFTVAILTLPLVALSFVLYRETQSTRLENSAPRLVLTIEPGRFFGFFDVVIANVGRGAAFKVETSLTPDINVHEEGFDSTSLTANRFISPPVLKPSQELRLYIGKLNEISPSISTVAIRYLDERGVAHCDTNVIDLEIYDSFGQLGPDNYLNEISKQLESMAKNLNKITSTDRLRVDQYDAADREKQLDRRTQQRRAFNKRVQTAPPSPAADPEPPKSSDE